MRFILASAYDVFVSVTDNDFLCPDGKYYSARGYYVAALMNGYGKTFRVAPEQSDLALPDAGYRVMFENIVRTDGSKTFFFIFDPYFFLIGVIYFIFGYFTLGVRVANILLSIISTYLIFRIAKRQFGELTANVFLLVALFLPTQIIYSISMARDFIRMFTVSTIFFIIYGGVLCLKSRKR